MTTPAAVTVSADKADYNVGDPITVTVEYPGSTAGQVTLTITAAVTDDTGAVTNATTDVLVNTSTPVTSTVGVTDSFGDVYAEQSNANGTAVLTSVVGTPPAA